MPPVVDLSVFSVRQLLLLYGDVLDELRGRDVVRSSNNPAGDYAELLCCDAFGWTREPKSNVDFDCTDAAGARYQVKGRRLTAHNDSTVLGDIDRIETKPFDALVGVLLNADFTVYRAAVVTYDLVRQHAKPRPKGKCRLDLRPGVWSLSGVRDVTSDLRAVQR